MISLPPGAVLRKRLLAAVLGTMVLGVVGCEQSAPSVSGPRGVDQKLHSDEIFANAIESLERLQRYYDESMFLGIHERLMRWQETNQAPVAPDDPLVVALWPEAPMQRQFVERMNEWLRDQEPLPGWELDPMVQALIPEGESFPPIARLDKLEFTPFDGFAVVEATWFRDLSNWARGEQLDDLTRAMNLFDWTVRNVALEYDPFRAAYIEQYRLPKFPWEALLTGSGSAAERASVFLYLARQQRIEACLLAIPAGDGGSEEGEVRMRPWTVGVLHGGEIYLFDPALGLPIPGPEGIGFDRDGQLDVRPATLSEVVEDPELLRQLDVTEEGEEWVYPVDGSQMEGVVAWLEASPSYVSQRMAVIEAHLTGSQRAVLTTRPSLLAEKLRDAAHIQGVGLWGHPFDLIVRYWQMDPGEVQTKLQEMLVYQSPVGQSLWTGRTLYLTDVTIEDRGASWYYQQARRPDQEAAQFLAEVPEEHRMMVALQSHVLPKYTASYWLGVYSLERGNLRAAEDYFVERTLRAFPGMWLTHAAAYNLGRARELEGKPGEAALLYRMDTYAPGRYGNLLRAGWLLSAVDDPEALDAADLPIGPEELVPAQMRGEMAAPTADEPVAPIEGIPAVPLGDLPDDLLAPALPFETEEVPADQPDVALPSEESAEEAARDEDPPSAELPPEDGPAEGQEP